MISIHCFFEIPERSLQLQIDNGAPRPLFLFMKLLESKITLLKRKQKEYERNAKFSPRRTPTLNRLEVFVHFLCTYFLSKPTLNQLRELPLISAVLSPLTIDEIKVLMQGNDENAVKTPSRAIDSSNVRRRNLFVSVSVLQRTPLRNRTNQSVKARTPNTATTPKRRRIIKGENTTSLISSENGKNQRKTIRDKTVFSAIVRRATACPARDSLR